MHFELKLCDDKKVWDSFVDGSPEKSVFCITGFLDALNRPYDTWFVKQGQEFCLGALVVKDQNGEVYGTPVPFSMYQGILFNKSYKEVHPHTRAADTLKAVDFLLGELAKKYNRIFFSLHHGIEDLRSFQWFNYQHPEEGQFRISLQYTGIIDLNSFATFQDYISSIRTTRRYEYRKALKEGFSIEESAEIEKLDYLHELTFKRQGIERRPEISGLVKSIAAAVLSKGFGELLFCKDKKGEFISATLYLHYGGTGYYLFGANHPDYRDACGGTLLMLENIRRCKAKGISFVDVCGINSPNRGDFKTSFNARSIPYFYVVWNKPNTRFNPQATLL
jgi:lipid II:glycine glycyltransferase (peptidoglycan interpeptide bridge formation enzyme)